MCIKLGQVRVLIFHCIRLVLTSIVKKMKHVSCARELHTVEPQYMVYIYIYIYFFFFKGLAKEQN
jgi:hypothetical protein